MLKQDAWNTVKLIIDPVTGTYKTYLNGSLHSTKGYISRGNDDAGITHVDVPASSLIALKCNKNVGAYNASAEYADITTVGIDNISFKKYTETVSVTLDGEEIDVTKDTALTLAKEGCTLDYAIVTPEDGEPYIVTTTAIEVEEGMTIECHWLEGEYFGYQSFDRLTTGVALGKNDGFSAVPAISEIRSEGEGVHANGYVHVPFVGDEAAGSSSPSLSIRA